MFILFHLFVQNRREQFFSEIRQLSVQISRYQKGKTNLDFTEARDSEWQ